MCAVNERALVADAQPGWYDDGSGSMRWWDGQNWTDSVQPPPPKAPGIDGMISRAQADAVAGTQPRPAPAGMSYVVLQVLLKEKFFGSALGISRNWRRSSTDRQLSGIDCTR